MRPFHSLRWSLQLWHALILSVVIAALCILSYRTVRVERMTQLEEELVEFDRNIVGKAVFDRDARAGRGSPYSNDEARARLSHLASEPGVPLAVSGHSGTESSDHSYFAAWDEQKKPLFVSKNAPQDVKVLDDEPEGGERLLHLEGDHLVFRHRTPQGFHTLSGLDIRGEMEKLNKFRFVLIASGTGLWLAGLAGGWWLAGRAIRPIGVIAQTASRIADGNLSERVETMENDDELASLGKVLNGTFDRLEVMIRQQKQFIADASHELRTPVTVILSETQRGLKKNERTVEEYREILQTTGRMSERMKGLIVSLLALAHQDLAEVEGVDEVCDLGAIVRESGELLQALAQERASQLSVTAPDVPYSGNPQALSMMVTNLVSNAIDHNPEGTEVEVKLTHGDEIVLTVEDHGQGIAPEHLPHLFNRFYRVDSARHSGDHRGLGLAIVQSAAVNHGGRVDVVSTVGEGTTFTVTLPLKNPKKQAGEVGR
ncbi:HAMP domain-containing protein [Verrucomicrobiaceae bacterium 5K15]|uniref:histidine kinase n=1 Tax=Oceaniferula flava TaxID=2800421 RepID=A0AAE2SGC2_9BACT|nr:ATP-binding protein [Oceaniferula flavus]MBK1856075.1 HAMP domain-containing protein [Oceaniferula flavus]MBM1137382.1 HAMP domain-containing protein [Oceaniferula flavus]